MSYFVKEEPKDAQTQIPPATYKWTLEMKIIVTIMSFILYVMLLLSAKTLYAKQQHLDNLDEFVLKTEEVMHNLHTVDRSLAVNLERIENIVYDEDNDMTSTTTTTTTTEYWGEQTTEY